MLQHKGTLLGAFSVCGSGDGVTTPDTKIVLRLVAPAERTYSEFPAAGLFSGKRWSNGSRDRKTTRLSFFVRPASDAWPELLRRHVQCLGNTKNRSCLWPALSIQHIGYCRLTNSSSFRKLFLAPALCLHCFLKPFRECCLLGMHFSFISLRFWKRTQAINAFQDINRQARKQRLQNSMQSPAFLTIVRILACKNCAHVVDYFTDFRDAFIVCALDFQKYLDVCREQADCAVGIR